MMYRFHLTGHTFTILLTDAKNVSTFGTASQTNANKIISHHQIISTIPTKEYSVNDGLFKVSLRIQPHLIAPGRWRRSRERP